ncbi:MAG: hypothetical protein LBD48_12000 [Treponema sp.]|jgi:hypothetical protein|nr:hypothetical protein [Treponema sp.]
MVRHKHPPFALAEKPEFPGGLFLYLPRLRVPVITFIPLVRTNEPEIGVFRPKVTVF